MKQEWAAQVLNTLRKNVHHSILAQSLLYIYVCIYIHGVYFINILSVCPFLCIGGANLFQIDFLSFLQKGNFGATWGKT